MNGRHLTKIALRVLIGAVAVSAVLGIYALLRRDLDEWSARTLRTTLFVSAASLLIMANAAGLERRSVGYLLHLGRGTVCCSGRTSDISLCTLARRRRRWTVEVRSLPGSRLGLRGPLVAAIASVSICSIPMAHAGSDATRRRAGSAHNLGDLGRRFRVRQVARGWSPGHSIAVGHDHHPHALKAGSAR